MPINPDYNPFVPANSWVIDDAHVRVDRRLVDGSAGRSVRFTKVFKTSKAGDFSWFNTHEAELLQDFKRQRMSRVVQVSLLNWNDQNAFEKVETIDAGPSLCHWLQVHTHSIAQDGASHRPAGSYQRGEVEHARPSDPLEHPFAAPQAFFLLLRSALLGLYEIHAKGYVHCDIDDRNLCLPFVRHPTQAGMYTPDWNNLRLIDFAFSLSREHPLRVTLPIRPDAQIHSPAFMQALEADYKAGSTRHVQKLDGRIDLFALGAMAARMLAVLQPRWPVTMDSGPAQALALQLVQTLKAQDTLASVPFDLQVHHRLLQPIDEFLNAGGSRYKPSFSLPGGSSARIRDPLSSRSSEGKHLRAAPTPLAPIPLQVIGTAAPTPLRPTAAAPAVVAVAPVARPQPAQHSKHSPASAANSLGAPQRVQTPHMPVRRAAPGTASLPGALMPVARSGFLQRLGDSVVLERFRRGAARGEAEACYQVGCVLLRGKAAPLDPAAALQWFVAAAQQGHAAAQAAVGTCFYVGYGHVQDDVQAAGWYTLAAQSGNPIGHYGLGNLLVYGRGLAEDPHRAIGHFRVAAQAGLPEAYNALGQLLLAGLGTARQRTEASECFRQAVELGHGPSAYELGRLCEHPDLGELPDPLAARGWYQRALKLGVSDAKADLARLQKAFPS